jgi:hypothetical protein
MRSIQAGVPRFGTIYYVGTRHHLGNWSFSNAPLTSWVSTLMYVITIMFKLDWIMVKFKLDWSDGFPRSSFPRNFIWYNNVELIPVLINIEIYLAVRSLIRSVFWSNNAVLWRKTLADRRNKIQFSQVIETSATHFGDVFERFLDKFALFFLAKRHFILQLSCVRV